MFPKRLADGYQSFLDGRFPAERSRYQKLAETGQNPEILIIGCCDSRVAPELIFDAGPGEMFVVRNVANLVPPCDPDTESSYHGTSAAIEFAVNGLNVKHIVVLGHASCGGVRAFYDDAKPLSRGDFIRKWMTQIEPVAEGLGESTGDRNADLKRLELAVIKQSLNNLLTFPSSAAASKAASWNCTAPTSASPPACCSCWTRTAANSTLRGKRRHEVSLRGRGRRSRTGPDAPWGAAALAAIGRLRRACRARQCSLSISPGAPVRRAPAPPCGNR